MNISTLLIAIAIISLSSCANGQIINKNSMEHKYTNELIHESSPYLLQHAHNPVNWHAWSKETLDQAKKENKPILVSIGYSSCHWCHVMEHQSFEDSTIAAIMNAHFICIKVDREEHPDVDQIYMNAVQLMTGSGGWPLNCFALPDGRPFFGGTYFPKDRWEAVLRQVANLYEYQYPKVLSYAENIENGIKESEQVVKTTDDSDFNDANLDQILSNWVNHLDDEEGGPDRMPKFPLPNNYKFLMYYAHREQDQIIDNHIKLTLDKMANGGIYDQLGGGFARYSTDREWKVPHFEKMLYDNAQLVSLYSEAYKNYRKPEYKQIVIETLEFIKREMTNNKGLFYSALDADSDGEEGKFYVWKKEKIKNILGIGAPLFEDYYQMNKTGYWEHDNYILMRNPNIEQVAKNHGLNIKEVESNISKYKELLMTERDKRIRPGLDDKSLISWNAMMITAYCDAFAALGDEDYKQAAITAMDFILQHMTKDDESLYHTYKEGDAKINAYLDDYAFMLDALTHLYEIGSGDKYLYRAVELTDFSIDKFYDKESGMFFFTSSDDEVLVTRKTEIFDNVIPASNSTMARNLFKLSHYFNKEEYLSISKQMLHNTKDKFKQYGSSMSNWGILMMDFIGPNYEVVISGNKAETFLHKMQTKYLPNVIWASSKAKNRKITLLENRYAENKTHIYVCINQACQLPVESPDEALKIIIKN
ncbi:MAG: thioredoxin domain-containing protein [Bacteroidales bacterium]|nr:thioredoxin domain-containing protein [Bacteroidales bacterium]